MPSTLYSAAIDLGATSGRVILGAWSKNRLTLTEAHRFPNAFRSLGTHDYWEIGTLWHEVQAGLHRSGRIRDLEVVHFLLQLAEHHGFGILAEHAHPLGKRVAVVDDDALPRKNRVRKRRDVERWLRRNLRRWSSVVRLRMGRLALLLRRLVLRYRVGMRRRTWRWGLGTRRGDCRRTSECCCS